MAVSYLERFSLIENVNFHKRIQVAIWTASAVVLVEDAGVPNHADRLTYARKALAGNIAPEALRRIALRLLTDANVATDGESVTDANLQIAIDALYDELAG